MERPEDNARRHGHALDEEGKCVRPRTGALLAGGSGQRAEHNVELVDE